MLPVPPGRMQAVPAILAESEDSMTGMRRPPLRGSLVSPVRVEQTSPEGWREFGAAEVRNGLPVGKPYVRAGAAREAEVAAIVAGAQARADAMPGAVPRCARCGKPAAECTCGVLSDN